MSKVLIIGAGGVGRVVVHKCAQLKDVFTDVVLASRTKAKCDEIAKEVEEMVGVKVLTEQVDADDSKQTAALIKKHKPDLVLNVALPALVTALITQLDASHRLQARTHAQPPLPLAHQWMALLRQRLEAGQPLPAIADSAAILGATTRTLQRACIQSYGRSPIALRRLVLAQAARRRLALGEPVSRVSADLGFSSSGHLGRLLRAVDETDDGVWAQ